MNNLSKGDCTATNGEKSSHMKKFLSKLMKKLPKYTPVPLIFVDYSFIMRGEIVTGGRCPWEKSLRCCPARAAQEKQP
jgi:hypothetical protein